MTAARERLRLRVPDLWLGARDAAEVIGCSVRHVYDLHQRRDLSGTVGKDGRLRFRFSSLEDFCCGL